MPLILSGTDGVSDVDGSAATPAVRGADANTGIFFPAADTIAFAEGGAEVARITNTAAWSFGASGTATGTNGQVLTSAGSGAAPTWSTPSTGSWVTLGSGTITGNPTTIDFETGFTDTAYMAIVIQLTDVFTNSGSGNATWRFRQGGSYGTTGYDFQRFEASGTGVSAGRSTNQSGMMFAVSQILSSVPFSDMYIIRNRFSTIAAGPSISTFGVQAGSGVAQIGIGQGVRQVGGAVEGARFYLSGGGGATILVSGTYTWYGIRAS
jgi:hypothetical protein